MYITAQVISVHVLVSEPDPHSSEGLVLRLCMCVSNHPCICEVQQILFMVSSIFVFQAYTCSLKSLHIIMTNQAISEVNRAVTKQLNGNQAQTKSMNVGQ